MNQVEHGDQSPIEDIDEAPNPASVRWELPPRRFILVATLLLGLVLFLARLPDRARDALIDGLQSQRPLVGLMIFFAIMTVSLVWSAGQEIDAWVFQFFNVRGYHPPWLDHAMTAITQLGNFAFALITAGAFYLLRLRRLAFEVILGVLTLWLFVETVKALTDRTRPFITVVGSRIVGWRARGRSFPSGHTAQIFFLASLLTRHFGLVPSVTQALYGIAALVALSRVYVGMHYPRDVLAGALLGTVWGILGIIIDPYLIGGAFR